MKFEFKVVENKKNILTSIIFLIFGGLIFTNPNGVISTTSKIFGIIFILYGFFLLIKNYYDTKQDSSTPSTTLVFGIVLTVIGILFIVLSDKISVVVQYVIGAWILFNGIQRLIIALSLGFDNNKFIVQLIVAILLLGAGLYTILKSNLPLQIVGLLLIVYSILDIIGYISNVTNKSNNNEKEEKVTEKIEKEIEVKEAKILEIKENNSDEETENKETKTTKKKTKKK